MGLFRNRAVKEKAEGAAYRDEVIERPDCRN